MARTRELPGHAVPALLALTIFAAPALGVPHEQLLQDTHKSAIVAFGALLAGLMFFLSRRHAAAPLRWHAALVLPLLLMAHALGSMAWSHTYLAGVEAIRWFLFSLILLLGLNVLTRERLPLLAVGVMAGGTVAAVWAALQFLFDFSPFPQGPRPASTFVNRNFFAEYVVCTLPFTAILLARARRSATVALLSFAGGLVILTICMTGARAALMALWLQLFVIFPVAAWRFRSRFACREWPLATKVMSCALVLGVVFGMGIVPTQDPQLAAEGRGTTALERAFERTASITPGDASLSIRTAMWRATGRMIAAHPVPGVGAGAWENAVPPYQADGAQLETDFYVHNEYLQLLAEYGLAGWAFLAGLGAWLVVAARRTWQAQDAEEGAWRAVVLTSVLALLIVSNAGFPWRMAATGALFALCLGGLAASDLRLGAVSRRWGRELSLAPAASLASAAALVLATGLAAHITWLAVESERRIVRASRIAITISALGAPTNPRWDKARAEMLQLLQEAVRINPHYRKLTPLAADELARWGDWHNAIWIWESVLASRPQVVAMLTNVARGYMATGQPAKAAEYIERARQVQPLARSVRSAEVLLHASTGDDARALAQGRQALVEGVYDFDLASAVFVVGRRQREFALAEQAMQLRLARWDRAQVQGWMQLAQMYDADMREPQKALQAYTRALAVSPEEAKPQVWEQIPAALRPRIDRALAPPSQTSASKG